ncbi:HIT family protein [Alkalihalobacillus sp. LMS39]|uniref:HIT family protein n=1 Tax=Alkalihalobacillus sp. LMS39 TaxID=2924032 RepID=UPI001FB4F9DD|nr:HIT family protein [Alkalihalobacillus sp. LMS39]UOE96391.1 HIT family protein [Alkalihalobacillus sp. LMS39]
MEDCFICQKHSGTIQTAGNAIYENEFVQVGHIDNGENPHYLGHVMIDLKRHAPTLADMTEVESAAFGKMMSAVSKALMETEKAEHVYCYVLGDAVPHLHMHVVPRYPNTPKQYWGPNAVYDWEEAPMGNEEDVRALCERLAAYFKNIT